MIFDTNHKKIAIKGYNLCIMITYVLTGVFLLSHNILPFILSLFTLMLCMIYSGVITEVNRNPDTKTK